MRHLLALLAFLLAAPAAEAASIEVKSAASGASLVLIDGDLELADIEVFRGKVASIEKATVALHSDGGSLLAGIRIGMLIRVKDFNTIVPDAAQCASACAVAWLGGAQRYLGLGAKIGFHAAYVQRAGTAVESGPGNAVLGAYLDQIGLSEDAIVYITQASPNSMKWMSADEAAQHGIEVAPLPQVDTQPAPDSTASAASQEAPQASFAGRAAALVTSLAAIWSAPNAQTLRGLDDLYVDKVFYHGKVTARQAVLSEKRRFAERWPQRSYKIQPHSLTTNCSATSGICRVQGIMDRELADPAANTNAHDLATFDYSITRSGEVLKIAAETISVSELSRSVDASNPLTSVQRTLERLLAQVSRIRPPDAPVRPTATIRR